MMDVVRDLLEARKNYRLQASNHQAPTKVWLTRAMWEQLKPTLSAIAKGNEQYSPRIFGMDIQSIDAEALAVSLIDATP